MDLLDELENMALNVVDELGEEDELSLETIQRWQRLFAYTHEEAEEQIEEQRFDLARTRVTDDHWQLVKEEKERSGHDRESYEHEVYRQSRPPLMHFVVKTLPALSSAEARANYLVKLEGVLDVENVQEAAGLEEKLDIINSFGNETDARFCSINGTRKQKIEYWLATNGYSYKPTFIRITRPADKAFDPDSTYPTLGVESTLPQHRANSESAMSLPMEDQYPVWYFFYGRLAFPDVLSRQLGLPADQPPNLVPATVLGGKLSMWGGKYQAMVDGDDRITGSAYLVSSKEHEELLRAYETDAYEVVRCTIYLEGHDEPVRGCCFRFAGDAEFP